jgi:hypothetical protein
VSTSEPDRLADNGRRGRRVHFWLRWAHVYISMFSLLVVLFFGVTGVTLNHPSWTFGDESNLQTYSGTLPSTAVVDGAVEFLVVSEFVREEHGVKGSVADFGLVQDEGSISYRAPGYAAELVFDAGASTYGLTVQQEGFVAVMNDLHKGRDSSGMWRVVIDVSGGLLVVVALTGLGLQFFLRKRRLGALSLAAGGSVVLALLAVFALS